ncbi:MAG TPA: hypothetical protein VFK41_05320 [Nocardioidaceae bacterium]|nr:hypothetical protein [Nocardioidaceae bacterium]
MSMVSIRDSSGRISRVRLSLTVAVIAILAVLFSLFNRLYALHDQTGKWTYSPSPAPPKIVFADRDYDRGTRQALPTGWVMVDRTPGGGDVYASKSHPGTPVLLFVRDGDETWAYGLIGGP